MLNPTVAFATFYALEYCNFLLQVRAKKGVAIERFRERVEAAFESFTFRLRQAIWDYLCLISFGEARWAESRLLEGWMLDCFPSGCTRFQAYKIAKTFNPWKFLPLLEKVFSGRWQAGYGGQAWLDIVRFAQKLKRLPPQVFVDTAIQLHHNYQTCFDKGVLFRHDPDLMDMLDEIFLYEPPDWLEHWSITKEAKQLLERAQALGLTELPLLGDAELGRFNKVDWGEGCPRLIRKKEDYHRKEEEDVMA